MTPAGQPATLVKLTRLFTKIREASIAADPRLISSPPDTFPVFGLTMCTCVQATHPTDSRSRCFPPFFAFASQLLNRNHWNAKAQNWRPICNVNALPRNAKHTHGRDSKGGKNPAESALLSSLHF
jgi:hypothetical protein